MSQSSYLIPNQTLPSLGYEDNLDDLREFAALVESLGINVAGTRIARYQSYYKSLLEGTGNEEKIFQGISGRKFDNPQDTRLYVLREVHELMWIIKGLKKHLPRGAEEKLSQVVGGRDFAALDNDTASRNTQFELRIASYFCQAGYSVDMSSLTDVIASRDGNTYYVECKRVTSYSALIKRLKQARSQLATRFTPSILASKNYGIIAMDVTKVAFTHNGLTYGVTADHTKDVIQDKLKEIDEIIIARGFSLKPENLLLLWLQIHIPALVLFPNQYSTRFSSFFVINNKLSERTTKAFVKLQQVLHIGDVADERTKPPVKLNRSNGIITLLKGTTVQWDDELLMGALDSGNLSPREKNDEILEMEIDGKKTPFYFWELNLVWHNLSKDEKLRFTNDRMEARFGLACMLMHQRSLFEPA
ncbi:MAG: hypothetical protein NT047_07450 [Deltaproteobacteria bacterium]|nr:hypothetical protein [Deltaproteobacteria bacterium]